MASSGLNETIDTVSVNASDAVLRDIKVLSSELKELKKSIDNINVKPVKNESVNKITKIHNKDSILKTEQSVKKLSVIINDQTAEKNVAVVHVVPDYIKHDENGETLSDDTENWACVHDAETNLMWEVKSQDDALRNTNSLYSWYDPTHTNMSGEPDGGRCQGGVDCDTNAYIKLINENNYCGHNDWRLPTKEQMQTLVDLRNGSDKVKINQKYFPNTQPSWYWTSSEKNINSEFAWYVLFRNGFTLSDLKERAKHIRLVRKNASGANGG